MATLPTPIRAALGLFATALDAVQDLVEHAPELPMEAVGNSMQLSMRLQQQYVALLTRGDEFIASLHGAPEEAPAWATFDDPPSASGDADGPSGADGRGDAFRSGDAFRPGDADGPGDAVLDSLAEDLPEAEVQDEPRHAGQGDPLLAAVTRKRAKAAARKTGPAAGPEPTQHPPGKRAQAANPAPGRKAQPGKAQPTKAQPAKAQPAKAQPAKAQPAMIQPGEAAPRIAAPRGAAPAKKAPSVKAVSRTRAAEPSAAVPVDQVPPGTTPGARPAGKSPSRADSIDDPTPAIPNAQHAAAGRPVADHPTTAGPNADSRDAAGGVGGPAAEAV